MSLGDISHTLVVEPLLVLCDLLFAKALRMAGGSTGFALILSSLLGNCILLPLYYHMEVRGREARRKRRMMDQEIARLKAHYKGREQYFYVRTVHRHHGYHPLKALLGSTDLFLQVVVFMTAYRYLANLPLLHAATFWLISDLGSPDALLWGVHLLPLLMTAANVASVLVYADSRRARVQGLSLAAIFLVLLYRSPSGLVLYWTTSNVFSWIRNLVGRHLVRKIPRAWRASLDRLTTQALPS